MKGKFVTMAVSFLLCVGMVGAGFASWIITSKTQETGEGEIKVDTVVDKRIKIDSVNQEGVDVYFGSPKAEEVTNITNPWLKSEDGEGNSTLGTEDLTSSFTLTLNEENLLSLKDNGASSLEFTATIVISGNDAYNTAIENGYIVAPAKKTLDTVVVDLEDYSSTTLSFDFAFAWGDFFATEEGNVNPYIYFNTTWTDGADEDLVPEGFDTAGDYALEVLEAIQAIGGVKISITVVGVVK